MIFCPFSILFELLCLPILLILFIQQTFKGFINPGQLVFPYYRISKRAYDIYTMGYYFVHNFPKFIWVPMHQVIHSPDASSNT